MALVELADLEAFDDINPVKGEAMILDATALAVLAAPCLADESELTDAQKAAAKAVLRGAILRWNDSGSGALQAQTAGPFSQTYDNRQTRRNLFWPTEIEQLQAICKGPDGGGAFSINTVPAYAGIVHSDVCALAFGALYCSCGAVLTHDLPLYENLW